MTIHKFSVVTVVKDWQHWVEKLVWIFFLRERKERESRHRITIMRNARLKPH